MKKNNYNLHGFVKVATCSPKIFLANPLENAKQTLKLFKQTVENESLIAVFPELGLTGYTCEDLFHSQDLLDETKKALKWLTLETVAIKGILVVGFPYQLVDGRIYNMAAVISEGKILGMIPKTHLPNYNEFYEKRWFTDGGNVCEKIEEQGQSFLISSHQIFQINNQVILGVEICEDLWAPNPPSTNLVLNGANCIVNLSASNELINKSQYRKDLILQQSARLNCAYLYASASSWESSKDIVFGGHCLIVENGSLLSENDRFSFEDSILMNEIDFNKLQMERRKNPTLTNSKIISPVIKNHLTIDYSLWNLSRSYPQNPFVPKNNAQLQERSEEILQIQATGLARRLFSINKPKILLGLSGGLDSTLALLVALEAIKKTNQPVTDIICISMPGFGTSSRTKNQAEILAKNAGVTFKEIDISETVRSHFKDIGHDENLHNVVYENSQARERTQILFDLANKEGGLVLGTGDLSELALGWATYNGDHMANYNVNASIPKTLVKHLVSFYAEYKTANKDFQEVLKQIVLTKISPELLPPNSQGEIAQETEEVIGPYLLHDFFLFHYIRNGFSESKIELLAQLTFKDVYSHEVINKWLQVFFKRFKTNQFKRTTMPPGPKVGSVSLSPRGDWRCPDER